MEDDTRVCSKKGCHTELPPADSYSFRLCESCRAKARLAKQKQIQRGKEKAAERGSNGSATPVSTSISQQNLPQTVSAVSNSTLTPNLSASLPYPIHYSLEQFQRPQGLVTWSTCGFWPFDNDFFVPFSLLKGLGPPPVFLGLLGDVYLDVTQGSCQFYGRMAQGWTVWPGPNDTKSLILHPYYPSRVLWCSVSNSCFGWLPTTDVALDSRTASECLALVQSAQQPSASKRKVEADEANIQSIKRVKLDIRLPSELKDESMSAQAIPNCSNPTEDAENDGPRVRIKIARPAPQVVSRKHRAFPKYLRQQRSSPSVDSQQRRKQRIKELENQLATARNKQSETAAELDLVRKMLTTMTKVAFARDSTTPIDAQQLTAVPGSNTRITAAPSSESISSRNSPSESSTTLPNETITSRPLATVPPTRKNPTAKPVSRLPSSSDDSATPPLPQAAPRENTTRYPFLNGTTSSRPLASVPLPTESISTVARPTSPPSTESINSANTITRPPPSNGTSTVLECYNCHAYTPFWTKDDKDRVACNECSSYYHVHGSDRPTGREVPTTSTPPVCAKCQTSESPVWREDNRGRLLCNTCGLHSKWKGPVRVTGFETASAPPIGMTKMEEVEDLIMLDSPPIIPQKRTLKITIPPLRSRVKDMSAATAATVKTKVTTAAQSASAPVLVEKRCYNCDAPSSRSWTKVDGKPACNRCWQYRRRKGIDRPNNISTNALRTRSCRETAAKNAKARRTGNSSATTAYAPQAYAAVPASAPASAPVSVSATASASAVEPSVVKQEIYQVDAEPVAVSAPPALVKLEEEPFVEERKPKKVGKSSSSNRCYNCGTTHSACGRWPKIADGRRACNKCFLYWRAHGFDRPNVATQTALRIKTKELQTHEDGTEPTPVAPEGDRPEPKCYNCETNFSMSGWWPKIDDGRTACNRCWLYHRRKGIHRPKNISADDLRKQSLRETWAKNKKVKSEFEEEEAAILV